ncbi:unnamed protein product [Lymnaea stagnalis]|uniref:Uncharacterized protein n=1 Tax=Lymnaea stagnalis TaxID=6523 RepID=A0AAV2H4V2_LYMST
MRMNIMMKAIICVVICFFFSLVDILVKGEMSCTPAEENKNHNISFTLPIKAENNDIRIESMYQHIGTCHPKSQICTKYDTDKFKITLTQQKDDLAVTVLIYNISRNHLATEKPWFIAYYENSIMDNKSICNITVFARPDDIRCFNSNFNDVFYVTCIAHKIYPKGICLYRINNDEPILTEMCSTKIHRDPDVFTSSCTFSLPLSELSSEKFTINVTMYPNVSNEQSNMQFGTDFLHSIILGPPKLIYAKESHTPDFQTSNLNGTVSVEINMICFPRPKRYHLIKEDGSEIKFEKVINGNSASDGYVITLKKDGESSSVTLYLNFTIFKTTDFTRYLLIIDNGISPGLNYSFSIEKGSINASSVLTLVVSLVASFIFATGLCLCYVWCCLKRKDGNRIKSQHLYEDGNIEERQVDSIDGNNAADVENVEYSVVNKGLFPKRADERERSGVKYISFFFLLFFLNN